MPQLKLAWWLFNFMLSWVSIMLMFTMIINMNLLKKNMQLHKNPNKPLYTHKNKWLWN